MKFDWGSILEMDEKARIKELMRRPGLFVGTARLDYLLHFAAGSDLAGMIRKKDHPIRSWNINVELQHWMLTRHSAIIRGAASLNAQTLFFRYFGTGNPALSEFSRYLHCDDYPIIGFNVMKRQIPSVIRFTAYIGRKRTITSFSQLKGKSYPSWKIGPTVIHSPVMKFAFTSEELITLPAFDSFIILMMVGKMIRKY